MKYKGHELRLKNKAKIVMPKPLLVEIQGDKGKEEVFVEPDNDWYTIVESYGKIKN